MDKNQILDEVIEYALPPRIQPGEFTVRQFAARHQELHSPLSLGQARRRLNRCVEAGILGMRKVLVDGFMKNVYHLIEKGQSDPNIDTPCDGFP